MQRTLQKAFSQRLENTANYRSALTLALHCHWASVKTNRLKHSVRLLPAMLVQGVVTFGHPDRNLSRLCRLRKPLQPDLPEGQEHRCMQRTLQKAFSQRLENTANYRSALTLALHCHWASMGTNRLKHSVRLLPAMSVQGVVTFGHPPPGKKT